MSTLIYPLQHNSGKDHDRHLHEGTVRMGGRTITKFRFADDISGLAGEEDKLAKLVECLDKGSTAYGTEVSAKKTKLMTNNTSNTEVKVNGQKLDSHKL